MYHEIQSAQRRQATKALQEQYGKWLQGFSGRRPWSYFGTITESKPRTARSWRRGIEHFLNKPRKIVDPYDIRPTRYYWGIERHASGILHAHILLQCSWETQRSWESINYTATRLWQGAFDQFGRSEIVAYDPSMGAAFYVSKYCIKTSSRVDLDWDFRTTRY